MSVFSDTEILIRLGGGAPLNLHWMDGDGLPMATQTNCAVPASGTSCDDGVGDMMEGRTEGGRKGGREGGREGGRVGGRVGGRGGKHTQTNPELPTHITPPTYVHNRHKHRQHGSTGRGL